MIIFFGLFGMTYLLGAFPTGMVMARWLKGVDIRQHGSGNVGATNVARVVGKVPGVFVLLIDAAKGFVPAAVFPILAISWGVPFSLETDRIFFGVTAIAGHIWNPFFQFQGGKGVATALGVLCALDARIAFGSFGIWILVAVATRYVSVASVAAALGAPFLMVVFGLPILWTLGTIGVSCAIIARHRPNFLRLLHGEEHPLWNSKKGP